MVFVTLQVFHGEKNVYIRILKDIMTHANDDMEIPLTPLKLLANIIAERLLKGFQVIVNNNPINKRCIKITMNSAHTLICKKKKDDALSISIIHPSKW